MKVRHEYSLLTQWINYADEEIHIHTGMEPFAKSEEFRNLNVGFGLDEGKVLINMLAPGEKCWNFADVFIIVFFCNLIKVSPKFAFAARVESF